MKRSPISLRSQLLALLFVAMFASMLTAGYWQPRWYAAEKAGSNIAQLRKEVDGAVANMKRIEKGNSTSLWQEINARGGGDYKLLRAKAIHENGGKLYGKSYDNGYCTYQITAHPARTSTSIDTVDYVMANNTILPSYKLPMGKASPQQRAEFLSLLNQRADLCVEAGLNVLKQKYKFCASKYGGYNQANCAICAYGGQVGGTIFPSLDGYFMNGEKFKDKGRCPASEEVRIITKLIDSSSEASSDAPTGGVNDVSAVATVNDDPNSADYNKVTYKINGTTISSDVLLACADSSNAIAKNLSSAAKAYQSAAVVRVREAFSSSVVADQVNPQKDIRGNIKKEQCIGVIFTYMDTLRNLLSGISLIKQAIMALIKSLLNQVCSFVATAINNVLASVCIPIPNLSLSLSLPSLSSQGCNGLSLLSVLQVGANMSPGGSANDVGRRGAWPLDVLQAPPYLGAPNYRK